MDPYIGLLASQPNRASGPAPWPAKHWEMELCIDPRVVWLRLWFYRKLTQATHILLIVDF